MKTAPQATVPPSLVGHGDAVVSTSLMPDAQGFRATVERLLRLTDEEFAAVDPSTLEPLRVTLPATRASPADVT